MTATHQPFFAVRFAPVILAIIAINFLVLLGTLYTPFGDALLGALAFQPLRVGGPAIQNWAMWLTHMYAHGGWLHFIMNMGMFLALGQAVVQIMGPKRFIVFYHLCGVLAAFAQYMANRDSVALMVGASGAVMGLLGGVLWLQNKMRRTKTGVGNGPFIQQTIAIVAVMIVLGMLNFPYTGDSASIAWVAHVAGFLGGIFLVPYFIRPNQKQ